MEEKTKERLSGVLSSLEELQKEIEGIAEVEASFKDRQEELNESLDALFAKQKELEDQFARLEKLLDNLSSALKGAEAIVASVDALQRKIDEFDVKKIEEAAETVGELSDKALKKIAEKKKDNHPAHSLIQEAKKGKKGKK